MNTVNTSVGLTTPLVSGGPPGKLRHSLRQLSRLFRVEVGTGGHAGHEGRCHQGHGWGLGRSRADEEEGPRVVTGDLRPRHSAARAPGMLCEVRQGWEDSCLLGPGLHLGETAIHVPAPAPVSLAGFCRWGLSPNSKQT